MPFNNMLIHLCDVVAYTTSQADTGAETLAASGTASNQPCRFLPPVSKRGNFEPMPEIGQQVQYDRELYLRGTVDVSTGHKVQNIRLRTTGGTVDGDVYEVVEVSKRHGRRLHHIACKLKKVK